MEERIIDKDDPRKIRIKHTAEGDDVVDPLALGAEEEDLSDEEADYIVELPEDAEEGYDEDLVGLTPSQLKARLEEKKRAERCGQLLAEAQTKLENSDFDNALYAISLIEEIDKECGRAYFLKFKALSSAFTDFSRSDDLKAAADCVNKFCTLEERAELLSLCAPLKIKLEDDEEKAAALHVENEQKKRERREVFAAQSKRALLWFSVTAFPFALFLVLAAAFGSVLFAYRDGRNVILTIVFAAAAVVFFVATLITGHRLWEARRKLALNEKNSSTKLGREYDAAVAEVEKYRAIIDDLS